MVYYNFTSHNNHKQVYAYIQRLGFQGLHNAASTTAHSHCLTFTLQGERHTHEMWFWKIGVVVDIFCPQNIDTFSKTANRKKFFGQTTVKKAKKSQMANPKIVRPTSLKYGQISNIWPKNGQSGNLGCPRRRTKLPMAKRGQLSGSVPDQSSAHKRNSLGESDKLTQIRPHVQTVADPDQIFGGLSQIGGRQKVLTSSLV